MENGEPKKCTHNKIQDGYRLFFAVVFFVVGLVILYSQFPDFISDIIQGDQYDRFFVTLASAIIGFAFIAYKSSKKPHTDTPCEKISLYLIKYLLTLILVSVFVYGMINLILLNASDTVLSQNYFYPVAIPAAFAAGYYIDFLIEKLPYMITKG